MLKSSSECRRPVCNECGLALRDTVGEGEAQLRCEELLDVWAANIFSLGNFYNAEDLKTKLIPSSLEMREKENIREST